MRTASLHGSSAVFMGAIAALLLVPQPAHALDLIFVFDGLIGTFRRLDVGVPSSFPPGEVEINFGPAKGLYSPSPRCILPDCGFISVTADGSIFTTPALFHGHNAGWQFLITSTPPPDPGASTTDPGTDIGTLYGTLLYCPGFEANGDLEQCPSPGPDTEPRGGRLDLPPRGDPDDPAVPGPIPVFGAAAAFGFSRRLRSRIRNSPQR